VKTEFVKLDQDRVRMYDEMIEQMSVRGKIKPEVVRTYVEFALKDFGEFSEYNHFIVSSTEKPQIINNVLQSLESNLGDIIETQENLKSVLQIARENLDQFFELEK
jgi:hypothetical protein